MTPTTDEPLFLPGPAGRLEARLRRGAEPGRVTALLCHPHPLFGGTLHNKTLFRLAKRLADEFSVTSLRFNFRGTGESEGTHDGGRGERGDVTAALDWLEADSGGGPCVLVGYSFGAVVGLEVGNRDPRVQALVGLGLPLQPEWDLAFLDRLQRPLCLVHGEHDEFAPGSAVRDLAADLPETELHVIPGADHLFHGHEDRAVAAVLDYILRTFPPDRPSA